MKQTLGVLIALLISVPVLAYEQNANPPFHSVTCEGANIQLKIDLGDHVGTQGAADIQLGSSILKGDWNWVLAPTSTRLSGYHFLYVNAKGASQEEFQFHTLYTPYNQLSGGWLQTSALSEPLECHVTPKEANQVKCKVPAQNNCSVSPKRLCCDCSSGQLSCY